jgi:signal peptidase II
MKRRVKDDTIGKVKYFFLIAASVILFDRLTKYFALNYLGKEIDVIHGFLSLSFMVNTGAAFGILNGKTIFLIIISALFLFLILFNIKSLLEENYYFAVALIFGGAVSNLFDRIFHGFVIDFIYVSFWPVFNLADSAISVGAVILFIYLIKDSFKKNS